MLSILFAGLAREIAEGSGAGDQAALYGQRDNPILLLDDDDAEQPSTQASNQSTSASQHEFWRSFMDGAKSSKVAGARR